MTRRAHTLVEMMIAVAILGILASMVGGSLRGPRLAATGEVQRARARVALDYRAECAMTGVEADPVTLTRLSEGIPGLIVEEAVDGDTATLRARWPGPWQRPETLDLTVFRGAR